MDATRDHYNHTQYVLICISQTALGATNMHSNTFIIIGFKRNELYWITAEHSHSHMLVLPFYTTGGSCNLQMSQASAHQDDTYWGIDKITL